MAETTEFLGTGRRKTAVARVRLAPGSGKITVNGRPMENYFVVDAQRLMVVQPLNLTDTAAKFDVRVSVCGGGPERPGWRGPAWDRPRAIARRLEPAPDAEGWRVSYPRSAHERAKEVRTAGGPKTLPVQ